MGHNDHIDFDLHDKIRDLVDEGELEEGTPAFGIVQQVILRATIRSRRNSGRYSRP